MNEKPPEEDTDGPVTPPPPELEELSAFEAPESSARGPGTFPPSDWFAILQNRVILGGLGILVVLLLITLVLMLFSSGDGGPRRATSVGTDPGPTSTPTETLHSGLIGSVRITTTVRNGPGPRFAVLGTAFKGTRRLVVGRNADDTWLQIIHPPGTEIRGWVDASFIDVSGDLTELTIAGPGLGPAVSVPTSVVRPASATTAPPTESPAQAPDTPTPSPAPATPTPPASPSPTSPPPTNTAAAPVTPPPGSTPAGVQTPQPTNGAWRTATAPAEPTPPALETEVPVT